MPYKNKIELEECIGIQSVSNSKLWQFIWLHRKRDLKVPVYRERSIDLNAESYNPQKMFLETRTEILTE
jgi:hypothetical protein